MRSSEVTPAVSVIMTVRNGARYLGETLDAILRQTFANFELVINDNDSTDETPNILRRYAAQDSRVRLLDPPGGGPKTFTQGIARAFAAARAPLVAVNDGDDVPVPDRLQKQAAVLDRRPDVVLVASWYDEIDSEGRPLGTFRVPSEHEKLIDSFQSGNPVAHSSMMYRRPNAVAVGGYQERLTYASDFALSIALVAAGGKIAVIPESLMKMRVHAEQTSLMPDRQAERYREPLEVLGLASRLGGASWPARLKGVLSRQKLALRYGLALWNGGKRMQGLIEGGYWMFDALWSPVGVAVAQWRGRANAAAGGAR